MRILVGSLFVLLWSLPAVVAQEPREPDIQTHQSGVTLSLVAEHSDLSTPTGIDVDDQGRIWLVSTHTHFRPDDYVGPKHDEILIFSDDDGDGKAEQRQRFYDRTEATMDLELGPDGWVYLAERDRILRVKDTDGDDVADVEEVIASLETEADYPHNGLEGLAWHPSGDLIFGIGENFAKPWTLTGTDSRTVSGRGEGGIFRCTLNGEGLRRIAKGFWNPFGICVRSDGEIFAAENDPGERPPCRLLHVVEGGDYGYQRAYGGEAHHPFVSWNGQLRGTLPMIHPTGEAPCGVTPLGRGLIIPSWSDHRIDFFLLDQKGASYDAKRIRLVQGSRYFRPACIAKAKGDNKDPNRHVWYLTDWVDGRYEAHGYGRLWKLEVDLAAADWVGPQDLQTKSTAAVLAESLREDSTDIAQSKLLELARHNDPFVARAALNALSKRVSDWTPDTVAGWPAHDRVTAVLALALSDQSPDAWARRLLDDGDAIVEFETLRWISDAQAIALLPDVQRYLDRSDLDYQRFEAAIASWNTLQGTPEAGIRNPELLLARVRDANSAPAVRAFALRLLPTQPRVAPKDGVTRKMQFPNGLSLKLLEQLLEVENDVLSLEVVRTLAGNASVAETILKEVAADQSRSANLRAEAIVGLAAVAEQQSDFLLDLVGSESNTVREEALRALRAIALTEQQSARLKDLAQQFPDSGDLFRVLIEPDSLTRGRPDLDDTDAWLSTIASVDAPVDIDAGRRIFHHARVTQCSNCHRYRGKGNVVGPDLSGVANRDDRKWLVQSILEPSREMAPEYQPRTILLKDGRVFTGIRLRSSTREAMRDTNGQNRTFNRDDIESMVESNVSFMPKGVVDKLTLRELRDLLAFLESDAH